MFLIQQMLQAFNGKNMARIFTSFWSIWCLNESMSIWHNKFTWPWPGWIYCPWKPHPHPYGNEYNTACWGKSKNIFFLLGLVEEEKDASAEFDKFGW